MTKFTHNPNVPGFMPLVELFSEYIAGRIELNIFIDERDKATDEARAEFKVFIKTFKEVTADLFKPF